MVTNKQVLWLGVAMSALGLGLGVAIVLQPDTLEVERSVEVSATPADLWPLVSDFAHRDTWDPWGPRDPEQVVTMSEATAGVGATYAWDGPTNGKGQMTVTEVVEPERVVQALEFVEPFASKADTTLALVPSSGGTTVTWSMHGENDLGGKFAMLLMDMEGMLGQDFEEGLTNLKAVGEERATARLAREAAEADARARVEAAGGRTAPGDVAEGLEAPTTGAAGVSHEGG